MLNISVLRRAHIEYVPVMFITASEIMSSLLAFSSVDYEFLPACHHFCLKALYNCWAVFERFLKLPIPWITIWKIYINSHFNSNLQANWLISILTLLRFFDNFVKLTFLTFFVIFLTYLTFLDLLTFLAYKKKEIQFPWEYNKQKLIPKGIKNEI